MRLNLIGCFGEGFGVSHYFVFIVLAKRSPLSGPRPVGVLTTRLEERALDTLLPLDPPRNTRRSPVSGPFGSVTAPAG